MEIPSNRGLGFLIDRPMSYKENLDVLLRKIFDVSRNDRVLDLETFGEALRDKMVFFEVESMIPTEGRIGPEIVGLDPVSVSGDLVRIHEKKKPNISIVPSTSSLLELESHSNFSSIRASACVYKGKWMYEVTLGTNGIQQLGWATIASRFNNEEGVGDAPDSFAYDGRRVKKWNITDNKYGQPWVTGDVIGCYADLDSGKISFSRNGQDLGVAFTSIRTKIPGLAYFPAVSLSHGERCSLNFGSLPFAYPSEGFSPMQTPPSPTEVNKASYLLECFHRLIIYLLEAESSRGVVQQGLIGTDPTSLSEEDGVIISATLLQHLAPILTYSEYLTTSHFVPFLLDLLQNKNYLRKMVEVMYLCLEEFEFATLVATIVSYLSLKCRSTTFVNINALEEQPPQGSIYLKLVIELLQFSCVRNVALQLPSFEIWLEGMFVTKIPNSYDLAAMFPAEVLKNEKQTSDQSEAIALRAKEQDTLMQELCRTLTIDSAMRKFYASWLRNLVGKNRGITRNIQPPGLSEPSVLFNLFFNAMQHMKEHYLSGMKLENFPLRSFVVSADPATSTTTTCWLEHFDLPRLGGTTSHLQKNLPITKEIFEKIASSISTTSSLDQRESGGQIPFEWDVMDSLVLIFMLGPVLKIKLAAQHLQAKLQTKVVLEDVEERMRRNPNPRHDLSDTLQKLRDEILEFTRLCAFHNAQLQAHPWKQEVMFSCIVVLVDILSFISERGGAIFSYIPEFFLETLFEAFNALRRQESPLLRAPEPISKIVVFLVKHCNDSRIVSPDLRELLIQTLNALLQNPEYLRVFEDDPSARHLLMKTILSLFDNRFWVSTTNILLRFWRGTGFGQAKPKQGLPSVVFQETLKTICTTEKELFSVFLNRLFDNLNSVVTEFVVPLKEIKAVLSTSSNISQYFKKCNVMFELSVSLTRIIEILSLEAPEVFVDQELNMMRLAEFLVYVLNRTTVGSDSQIFEAVLQLKILGLEKISRLAILSPIVGIITNLYKEEGKGHKYSIVQSLAKQSAFSLDCFDFLQKFDWKVLPEDASQDQLIPLSEFVEKLREYVEAHRGEKPSDENEDSDDLCAICYSSGLDVHFEPCKHQSCHSCVERHLLNSNKCFFCNAEIKSVVPKANTETNGAS